MSDGSLANTRLALHAVAEFVLAGPQYRTAGTIKLVVTANGFRTTAGPDVRVEHTAVRTADATHPIDGQTPAAVAVAAGLAASALDDVYGTGSGLALDAPLRVDPAAATQICDALAFGDAALRRFAPDASPVLWPEHFDVAIRVAGVNYGVSPGDGYLALPYAYIGVDPVPADPFWNAPFGRTRPVSQFADADALAAFFAEAGAAHRQESDS